VTGHDDEATARVEEVLDALLGEVEEGVDVASAVGGAPAVAEVEKIARGERVDEVPEHREPAEA
jgi:hypothetical protein